MREEMFTKEGKFFKEITVEKLSEYRFNLITYNLCVNDYNLFWRSNIIFDALRNRQKVIHMLTTKMNLLIAN
ncbi:hypothetical protein RhiirA1_413339 [Rhizophagus irregularis]|uniref:Uncharacterized protein n=2 Tax=Rhizophagus irregularis TaxID=588596 RepID=A0A2N0S700_9GLOM|nr:hypothetical protein RhiirA1_413339 [Rhizophagus irregularis]GBC45720.1 hypothetical protein RIR_jg16362.t1 [Rhizophagus irregularis DAOM 181602=DAOM 197198]